MQLTEEEQLEERINFGESRCNFGDGTDQRVQSLMFMMMINCNWVVTRCQWLFYMYTKYDIGY